MDLDRREREKVAVVCDYCHKTIFITTAQRDRSKHQFCDSNCYKEYTKMDQVKLICAICGKDIYRKKSYVDNMVHPENATCSRACCAQLRKTIYKGEGNRQYGLTGSKNASWKSDSRYEYDDNKYKLIRVEDHPFRSQANFVPEHRLIAEKYLLNENNSIEINGKLYLKPECVVHHIDLNKKNNDVNNLYVFENESLHTLFHNLYKTKRVESLEEFFDYYKNMYVNKLYSYEWLYKAYIEYGLSVNQISKLFNLPYKSVQNEIYKTSLDEKKKLDTSKDALYKLIVEDLMNFKKENN